MRMINADELEARVINFQGRGKKTFLEMLASQPTAYDIDKVVEQLEKFKELECGGTHEDIELYELGRSQGKLEAYLNAIEIVKGSWKE